MSSTPQDVYAPSLSVTQVVIMQLSTLSVMYFVYGLYVLLFGTYLYMMRNHGKIVEKRSGNIYFALIIILFVLSTIFVVQYTINLVRDSMIRFNTVKSGEYEPLIKYFTHDIEKTIIHAFHGTVPVLLNITAEWILIHRCYLIWGSKKRVVLPLIATSSIINALGIVTTMMVTVGISDRRKHSNQVLYDVGDHLCLAYNISSAVNNVVLTSLTAGRIWWINRQSRAQGFHESDKLIESVFRIILESGMIYPLATMADLIVVNIADKTSFDPFPISTLSAGIAPTLIMVRAKLVKNVESLQYPQSDIRFTSGPIGSDPIFREGTVDPRSRAIHAVGNLTMLPESDGGSQEKVDV